MPYSVHYFWRWIVQNSWCRNYLYRLRKSLKQEQNAIEYEHWYWCYRFESCIVQIVKWIEPRLTLKQQIRTNCHLELVQSARTRLRITAKTILISRYKGRIQVFSCKFTCRLKFIILLKIVEEDGDKSRRFERGE